MQVSRGIEEAIEVGIKEMVIDRYRYRRGVEEQSIKCKNRSSIYPPGIEEVSRNNPSNAIEEIGEFSIYPPGIEKLSR